MLPFYSSVLGPTEEHLLEQVLQFKLPLHTKTVDFGNLLRKVRVEFSGEKKFREEQVTDMAAVQSRIDEANRQLKDANEEMAETCKRRNEIRDRYHFDDNLYGNDPEYRRLSELACRLERRIGQLLGQIATLMGLLNGAPYRTPVLGEFCAMPYPTVKIYHKNFSYPLWEGLAAVFVHEMFHAWYYFEAGGKVRSVPEVDEPMVEFSTLYFLRQLARSASPLAATGDLDDCLKWQEHTVRRKQTAYGLTAAYGFGIFIYDRLTAASPDRSPLWIEAYSNKSASISASDSVASKIVKALNPAYPFSNEDLVFKDFQMLLFGKASVSNRKTGNTMTFRDLLLACLKVLGKTDFINDDIYRYKPVFQAAYPNNSHIKEKICQTLQQLEAESILTRIGRGVYHIN